MSQRPAPTGVTAKFLGPAGGSTTWYYWVQALYPEGLSELSAPGNTGGAAQSSLSSSQFNNVQWNATPGAIGYVVFKSTSSTTPVVHTATYIAAFTSQTGFKDDGTTYPTTAGIPRYDGVYVAHAIYDFAVDGGVHGSPIIPANSDTIPLGALVIGGVAICKTSFATSTNLEAGTSAGSSISSILTSAGIPSAAALIVSAAQATPFRMTAAGQIAIEVTAADATAGVLEIFVEYVMSSYL